MNIEPQNIYRRKDNIVVRKVGDEYVLVPVVSKIVNMETVYNLNEVAGFIWQQLDGEKNIEIIANEVASEFEIDREIALYDLMECLIDIEELLEAVN